MSYLAVINKYRKCGTTVTLSRTGRPSKIDKNTKWKLVREAAKRPTATLKELKLFLASTGCYSCLPYSPPISAIGQGGKTQKLIFSLPKQFVKMCYGLVRPTFPSKTVKGIFVAQKKPPSHQQKNSKWQWHASCFSSAGTSEGGRNQE